MLTRMPWERIREPGCYVHLPSGLLARLSLEDLADFATGTRSGGTAVRLSTDPGTAIDRLREIARRHGLPISF